MYKPFFEYEWSNTMMDAKRREQKKDDRNMTIWTEFRMKFDQFIKMVKCKWSIHRFNQIAYIQMD